MDTALIIDGKKVAIDIRNRIKGQLARFPDIKITLATVLIGENPASQLYISRKQTEAHAAGMHSKHVQLPADISQADLIGVIEQLAQDDNINGILVQLPLPEHIDKLEIIERIPAYKDVDGLTSTNMGKLLQGIKQIVPCTPLGVIRLLQAYNIPTSGRHAVIVGRSSLVGLPQSLLLAEKGIDATVTLAHSRTSNLAEVCRSADIIISAVGSPKLIKKDFVKPGAHVFDVGVSRINGQIIGDVDYETVAPIAAGITPMPGGTGPMTVACLLENTLLAAQIQGKLPHPIDSQ